MRTTAYAPSEITTTRSSGIHALRKVRNIRYLLTFAAVETTTQTGQPPKRRPHTLRPNWNSSSACRSSRAVQDGQTVFSPEPQSKRAVRTDPIRDREERPRRTVFCDPCPQTAAMIASLLLIHKVIADWTSGQNRIRLFDSGSLAPVAADTACERPLVATSSPETVGFRVSPSSPAQ